MTRSEPIASLESFPSGLRSGDGVFETVRTYSGQPFRLRAHLERLRRGARALGLAPVPSLRTLERGCLTAVQLRAAKDPQHEWVLRPMVYAASGRAESSILVDPLPVEPTVPSARGLVVGVSSYPHPGRYLVPARGREPVKWLARGPLAHALREARARGWEEALLQDSRGRFVEGTRSNLFAVVKGRILSPGVESQALPGVTRALALELAGELGVPFLERPIEPTELTVASEVFLTSSLLEIAPVRRIVGVWQPPLQRQHMVIPALIRAFGDRVRTECEG